MQILMIAGTVGKDAELRRTGNGDAVLGFSLAVDNGKDKSGQKRDATWYDCSIWGKRAEALEGHITKGSKLSLSGRPSARAHNEKAYLCINVNELTFQGGGQERQQTGNADRQDGAGAGGRPGVGGSSTDMDDEIPFAAEGRV
jgi:single-strand DNA-binding protein